jgi:uncharacterized protein (DUF1810 family)
MTIDLARFVDAQQHTYPAALAELRAGHKHGHWMWFIFPQLRGLGRSETARFFGIADLVEAEAYLQHPILGARLVECTRAVYESGAITLRNLLDYPDDMKFISSMTLFSLVPRAPIIFQEALNRFNSGQPDAQTLTLLGNQVHP